MTDQPRDTIRELKDSGAGVEAVLKAVAEIYEVRVTAAVVTTRSMVFDGTGDSITSVIELDPPRNTETEQVRQIVQAAEDEVAATKSTAPVQNTAARVRKQADTAPPPPPPIKYAPEPDMEADAMPAPGPTTRELVKLRQGDVSALPEQVLRDLAKRGGFDPDPLVLRSGTYRVRDIDLGNKDQSYHAYLVTAAAVAVAGPPVARVVN